MSTPVEKRLMEELKRLQDDPPAGISATLEEDNIMVWNAVISGPENTPWEGGIFKLNLYFSHEYPNVLPGAQFTSPMFHPNVSVREDYGTICFDIPQDEGKPNFDAVAILTSIRYLLADPNPDSPANVEAAKLFYEDKAEYSRRVQETVEYSRLVD